MSQILLDANLTKDQQNYRNYNLFKSTAWILPILFIFITQQKNITNEQIIYTAGLFGLLPFIIEIPFGVLADKIGTQKILILGIIFQILSCVSLILASNQASYFFYLICINFASALFSGADQSFVRNLFDDQEKFKTYLIENNGLFYRNSIFMLILGTLLFQINPYLPFVIQIVSFLISLKYLMKIKIKQNAIKNINIKLVDHLSLSLKIILNNNKLISIVLMSSIFDIAISLNHKMIQQQISKIIPFKFLGLLGITYVLGNLSSFYSSRLYVKIKNKFKYQIFIPLFLMITSYFLLSMNNLIYILVGFILICGFKSIYRPLCDGEMTLQIPISTTRATVLSIVSIFSATISLFFSFILSKEYSVSIQNGNTYFLIYTLPIVIFGIVLYFRKNNVEFATNTIGFAGKRHYLFKHVDSLEFLYKSYYPQSSKFDELNVINTVLRFKPYNSSQIVIEQCNQTKNFYTLFPYFGELHLWQVDEELQKEILTQIFSSRVKVNLTNYDIPKALIDQPTKIFSDKMNLKIIETITDQSIIHGDLHPDNILIHNSTPKLIDWDLSGVGPFWFDVLTLLTSPKLSVQLQYRISVFSNLFHITDLNAIKIFTEFIIYKIKSLENLSIDNSEIESLIRSYKLILNEIQKSNG